jgi:hypothetical protein
MIRFGREIGALRRVRHSVLPFKDGSKFMITNALELTSAQVKLIYQN